MVDPVGGGWRTLPRRSLSVLGPHSERITLPVTASNRGRRLTRLSAEVAWFAGYPWAGRHGSSQLVIF